MRNKSTAIPCWRIAKAGAKLGLVLFFVPNAGVGYQTTKFQLSLSEFFKKSLSSNQLLWK
jgi:hypothetical protein